MNWKRCGYKLEENAYHEAGHAVIAVANGLALRPRGILIFEVDEGTTGFTSYWK
jgi:hypothetical protein